MLIDWFTVGAQLLNFVLLVWLLKRFLYKPILKAIDVREAHMASQLAEVERKSVELEKLRGDLEKKKAALDADRAGVMSKAVVEAKAEGDRLISVSRQEAAAWLVQYEASVEADDTALIDQLARSTTAEIFNVARKALTDLASADLEEQIAGMFVRRLGKMEPKTRESLKEAIESPQSQPVVRSAFVLSPQSQAAIRNAVNQEFSVDIHLQFETAPEAVCGIELNAGGQRLAWNIAEYLKSLEQKVSEAKPGEGAALRIISSPPIGHEVPGVQVPKTTPPIVPAAAA